MRVHTAAPAVLGRACVAALLSLSVERWLSFARGCPDRVVPHAPALAPHRDGQPSTDPSLPVRRTSPEPRTHR